MVGVVYQPINDVLFGASKGRGAFVEEFGEHRQLHVSREGDLAKVSTGREPLAPAAPGGHDY